MACLGLQGRDNQHNAVTFGHQARHGLSVCLTRLDEQERVDGGGEWELGECVSNRYKDEERDEADR